MTGSTAPIWAILAAAAGLAGGAVPSLAAPGDGRVRAGVEAWSRGDWAAAVREWQAPAAAGDADAQFNLAQAYKLGRGVPTDLAKATALFGKAAAQGHLQAADNYGLMLFNAGQRTQALPFVRAAADRGDARAQYLLGIAHFNGDIVPRDWVRAYALMTLARTGGVASASAAMTEMDKHIPLDQRQAGVVLAGELADTASATRARQLAAVDLGGSVPVVAAAVPTPTIAPMPAPLPAPRPVVAIAARPPISASAARPRLAEAPALASAAAAVAAAARAAGSDTPRTAGADYAGGRAAIVSADIPAPRRVPAPAAIPAPRPVPPPRPVVAAAAHPPAASGTGPWRVQFGAFGVSANAEALWNRVKGLAPLAGHARMLVPAGRLIKLQAGGFASRAAAQAACSALGSAIPCLPVTD